MEHFLQLYVRQFPLLHQLKQINSLHELFLLHLNAAGITHGGYLSALIDAGAGTAAHRAAGNTPCVTISLDIKFIGASKVGDEIIGHTKILKKTNTLVFLFCELKCNDKIITSASGVWKIIKIKPSNLGPGG